MKQMYIDLCCRGLYRAATLAFLQKERETGWWCGIASITLVIFLIFQKAVVLVDIVPEQVCRIRGLVIQGTLIQVWEKS